jgi:hypothetical protein
MIDFEKLLICDGRPNKEMIDYLVEKTVKEMVDQAISVLQKPLAILSKVDVEKFTLTDKSILEHAPFTINCYTKYCDEICNNIEDSLKNYSPIIKINHERGITVNYGDGQPDSPLPIIDPTSNFLITVIYPLTLEITPEMKKAMLLDQELSKKEETSNRRLKI